MEKAVNIVTDTKDIIYIGKDFPDEYIGSKYTFKRRKCKSKSKCFAGGCRNVKNCRGKTFQEKLRRKAFEKCCEWLV